MQIVSKSTWQGHYKYSVEALQVLGKYFIRSLRCHGSQAI